MNSIIDYFAAARSSDGYRPRGVEAYVATLGVFARFAADQGRTLLALTTHDLEVYKRLASGRNLKPVSVAFHLTVYRAFARWAVAAGLRPDDPTAGMRFPKKTRPKMMGLSATTVRLLLARLHDPREGLSAAEAWQWERNRRAILLMLFTGMRLSEAAGLRRADVDREAHALVVRDGKGGKGRKLPISKALQGELERLPLGFWDDPTAPFLPAEHGGPLHRKSLAHIFERWVPRELGLSLTAHQLRRAFATRLDQGGVSIRTIQELLGHANIATTQLYIEIGWDGQQGAVDGLSW